MLLQYTQQINAPIDEKGREKKRNTDDSDLLDSSLLPQADANETKPMVTEASDTGNIPSQTDSLKERLRFAMRYTTEGGVRGYLASLKSKLNASGDNMAAEAIQKC